MLQHLQSILSTSHWNFLSVSQNAFDVAVISWLHAVDTVHFTSCEGRCLSRGSDFVEKQWACLCVCVFYKFVCNLTCSVTEAVCDLVWIVPRAVRICSMSFV